MVRPSVAEAQVLTAANITTAPPTVGSADVVAIADLDGDSITTGQPSVSEATVVQVHDLTANGVTTGQPDVQASTMVVTFILLGNDITTGQPVVGELSINASGRRVISITSSSINNVTLAETYNSATTSGNQNKVA